MEKTSSPNLSVVPEYRELVRLVRTWLIPEALRGNVKGHVPGLLSWRVGWRKPVVKVTLELQLEQIEESGM